MITLSIPLCIILFLNAFELLKAMQKQGEPKTGTYSVGATFFAIVIFWALIIWHLALVTP